MNMLATWTVKWLVIALAIFFVAWALPGVHVPDFQTALLGALALGILNITLRPILKLLTFPITMLTLGLFALIVNGFVFWLATLIVNEFSVDHFWWAVLASVIVSAVSAVGNRFFLGADGKVGNVRDAE